MDKQTLTLTRALTKLKTLDRQISSALSQLTPVTYEVGGKPASPITTEEFNKKAKAAYESVKDLINYRAALKRAVVRANASTEVKVNGMTMTIAEAIDYKNIIKYKKDLLKTLRTSNSDVLKRIERVEQSNEEKLQQMLNTYLGNDKGNGKLDDIIKNVTDSFKKANEVKFVDPLKVANLIETLEQEITDFDTEIDAILSETNGKTEIEVEF